MTSRRSGLGRGLEALLAPAAGGTGSFRSVPVERIRANPNQPRNSFEEEGLASLAASIVEVGILQPLVVKESDGDYVLVGGERRLRAARRAGLVEVPVVVRTGDDRASLTEALVENLQRQDLGPLEEAGAYRQLLEDFGMKHEEIGARVGKSRAAVTNTLRLLTLPASIQGMIERGALAAGHARALAGLEDRKFAEYVAKRAASEGWSVRQVEEAVRLRRGDQPEQTGAAATAQKASSLPEIVELEKRLSERLELPVAVKYRGNKGSVRIDFSSLDDLERIYRRFFG